MKVLSILLIVALSTQLLADPPVTLNPGDNHPLPPVQQGDDPALDTTTSVSHDTVFFTLRDGQDNVIIDGELYPGISRSKTGGFLLWDNRFNGLSFGSPNIRIVKYAITGYAGIGLRVGYRTDSLGEAHPVQIARSADGDTITLTFDGNDASSIERTMSLALITNANAFDYSGSCAVTIADGSNKETTFVLNNIAVPVILDPDVIHLRVTPISESQAELRYDVIPDFFYELWSSNDGNTWEWQGRTYGLSTPGIFSNVNFGSEGPHLFRILREEP